MKDGLYMFMFPDTEKVKACVVGGGAWGTAIANLLANRGHDVAIWVYEPEVKDEINLNHENKTFLAGIPLNASIKASNDLAEVTPGRDIVVMVTPSHLVRHISMQMAPLIGENTVIVSAAKGIEEETMMIMTDILAETLHDVPQEHIAALSGPSFAKEVGLGLPAAVTAAANYHRVAKWVQRVFSSECFRVYTTHDMIGVELGGAVKNVIAIATGACDTMQMGLNARAALLTRGIAEIKRLGVKMGADERTFIGLSGYGDLVLTCTGELSRNRMVGQKIGQGQKIADILADMRMVAEGVKTAKSVYMLARKMDVTMPICEAAYRVLYEDYDARAVVRDLMTRTLKSELE